MLRPNRLALILILGLMVIAAYAAADLRIIASEPENTGGQASTTPIPIDQYSNPATAPPSPSPSPVLPPHPLSIETLRNRSYTGSDVVIEQELAPGVNYSRYIASYDSDGLKIYALLTIPNAVQPPTGFPVIIFNHGYIPPSQYRTTERYVAYVDAFARNGYIVFRSDYRGHGNSEGRPESAYRSSAYTIDVLNAVASVRRMPEVDPNRIGMWGHSMGGYITLRAMVVDPGIVAGVIWGGVVVSYEDLFEMWFRRSSEWQDELSTRYGSPQENPAFWDSLSANSYLRDLNGPLQLHHGTGDSTVPYQMSVILDEEMRAAGMQSELLLYERDNHNISINLDLALTVSVVFFDEYVKNR